MVERDELEMFMNGYEWLIVLFSYVYFWSDTFETFERCFC